MVQELKSGDMVYLGKKWMRGLNRIYARAKSGRFVDLWHQPDLIRWHFAADGQYPSRSAPYVRCS
ncbi:hypothetical protein PAHAL_4G250900 [Panicum hallii]|uniref:Uncharacterized protein n=1 Tax=Panicum hallii TaxID=206008 RepID=A0A2T8JDU7_9POAL|nr:hypothetical protein PAHAL_4G250900 [Panicum hallii]